MANYTTNKLTIVGTTKQINMVLNFIKNKDEIGTIDFNKIVPLDKNCRTYLYWKNWGTCWNASCQIYIEPDTIMFDTAWCAIPGLIAKLSLKFPEIIFHYSWVNQNYICNASLLKIKNGEIIGEYLPSENTKEAYKLACYIYGNPITKVNFKPEEL